MFCRSSGCIRTFSATPTFTYPVGLVVGHHTLLKISHMGFWDVASAADFARCETRVSFGSPIVEAARKVLRVRVRGREE